MDVIHSCTNAFPNPFKSLRTCTPLSTTDDTKIEYLAPVTKQYEPPSNFGNHPNFHRRSKRNKSHHRRNLAQNVPPQSFFHSLQTTLIRLRNNWVGKTETTRLLSLNATDGGVWWPPEDQVLCPRIRSTREAIYLGRCLDLEVSSSWAIVVCTSRPTGLDLG